MRARPLAAITLLALALAAACAPLGADEPGPCAGQGTRIRVLTAAHRLYLCHGDAVEGEVAVALGRGGTGKRVEGDLRTPLGDYPLGAPRASDDFHVFIPVGYPTEEQRRAGYTGGDIGVHGPARRLRRLGAAAVAVDWTRGCIAVPSDDDIDAIAAWVARRAPADVLLE